MKDEVKQALASERVIDITTTGRKSGQARRIEIWFHYIDGKIYLTGRPGPRSWYANLRANPDFIFHLKGGVEADLAAKARPVTNDVEKRAVLLQILPNFAEFGVTEDDIDEWVNRSPLIEVTFKEA